MSGGRHSPFSVSNLPTITCRHPGATTTFSLALTSHVFLQLVIVSEWRPAESCSSICRVSCWLSRELRPALPPVKTVCAVYFAGETLCSCRALPKSARGNFPFSKSITALNFSRKSVPSRLGVSRLKTYACIHACLAIM